MLVIRRGVAAGIFYNSDRDTLVKEVESSFFHKLGPKEIKSDRFVAAVVPHDKYHLSGHVAAWVHAKLESANYIILGPNHNQIGSSYSVMKEGLWKTPLGEVAVSTKTAQKLLDKTKLLQHDITAHNDEHSIEVQLPFIQYRFGSNFKFVPILITNSFSNRDFVESCKTVGKAIAEVVKADREKWVVIATTDMSSGMKDFVRKTDKKFISAIKNLSENKLFQTVNRTESFICGYGALIATLSAAKELGAKKSKLLKYSSSFDVVGDPSQVSGYASFIIH